MSTIHLVVSAKSSTNCLRKFTCPKNDLTPILFDGRLNLLMASTHLGSILIPSWETIWPRSFPSITQKMDFLGLSEIPCSQNLCNTFFKSSMWSFLFFENMVRSSRYITIIWSFKSTNILLIHLWNVVPTLMSPKGILWYANWTLSYVDPFLPLQLDCNLRTRRAWTSF